MNKFNESNKLEKELEDRKKMCRNCKWCYLTGSSEPCKSCANSSKRNLNWEPKGGISDKDDYKIGDTVKYHVMDVSNLKDELKTGEIIAKEAVHSNYDFTITDVSEGMRWGVNKEWIVEKVLTVKDESSMHPSTIIGEEFFINTGFRGGKTFASECMRNNCESVKSFLNRIYGNPDFKQKVHSDATDSLSYSIKRKLDRIHSNALYGLNTDLTFYDEFVNKEDNKMKNQQKRNRNIIKVKNDCPSEIKEVMFNGPATIIKWQPTNDSLFFGDAKGEKTVVVCKDDEQNMTVGFLLAVVKGLVDNQSYDNILRKIDGFSKFDIPQVGKECKYKRKPDTDWDVSKVVNSLSKKEKKKLYYELEKAAREAVEGTEFKFEVGDIVRLKSGASLYKVVKRYEKQFGSRMVRYYRLKSNSPSEYLTTEREERLVLAEGY